MQTVPRAGKYLSELTTVDQPQYIQDIPNRDATIEVQRDCVARYQVRARFAKELQSRHPSEVKRAHHWKRIQHLVSEPSGEVKRRTRTSFVGRTQPSFTRIKSTQVKTPWCCLSLRRKVELPHGAKEKERLTCSESSIGSAFGVCLVDDDVASKYTKECCGFGPYVRSSKRTTRDGDIRCTSTIVVATNSEIVFSVSLGRNAYVWWTPHSQRKHRTLQLRVL